jgi:hypothetical protein
MFIAFLDVITKFDCNGYELNSLTFSVFKNFRVLISLRRSSSFCTASSQCGVLAEIVVSAFIECFELPQFMYLE